MSSAASDSESIQPVPADIMASLSSVFEGMGAELQKIGDAFAVTARSLGNALGGLTEANRRALSEAARLKYRRDVVHRIPRRPVSR